MRSGARNAASAPISTPCSRAKVDSDYQPAWRLRLRMMNGHYPPNPALRLRISGAGGQDHWLPIAALRSMLELAQMQAQPEPPVLDRGPL